MESRSKRIVKNTLFLYFRMAFLMLITLYTSRVLLDKLGIEDFGIYNVVGGIAMMFTFFSSSLANVTQRFLNIELGRNNIRGASDIFNQHLFLYISLSIIVIIFAESIGLWFINYKLVIPIERQFAAICVFQFSILSLCVTLIGIVFNSVIIAHEDMKIYSYISVFEGIAKLIVAYVISISVFDRLIFYGLLLFLITIFIQSFYAIYCIKNFTECKLYFIWDKVLLKNTSAIVGWNIIGTAVYAINDSGINVLLNIFFGPIVNAARAISFQISSAVSNLAVNFFTSVRPQIVKSYASGDFEYLVKLFFNSSRYSFYLLWFLCLPVMFSIDTILNFWLKEVPDFTGIFTIWVLIYSLINVLNNPVWSIALAVGKLKNYILIGSSIFLLIFPLSYIALKMGASPISVFIIMCIVRTLYLIKVLDIIREYINFTFYDYLIYVIKPILKVICLSVVLVWSIKCINTGTVISFIIFIFISFLIILFTIYMFGITKEENKVLKNILYRKILNK